MAPILLMLKGALAPLAKVGLSVVMPLLTEKMARVAIYRLAKKQADAYAVRARETPDREDDKKAEFFQGIVKEMGEAYGIKE